MTQAVIEEMNSFIRSYGEQKGYQIIIGATQMGNLVYAEKKLDVTDEVLSILNNK